jgi:hypothetical protein
MMLTREDLPFEFCKTNDIGPDLIETPLDRDKVCVSVYRV